MNELIVESLIEETNRLKEIETKQRENAKRIERANSYRDMINSWAWKDLMVIAEEKKSEILEKMFMSDDIDVKKVNFAKGYKAALDDIFKNEIGFILSPLNDK